VTPRPETLEQAADSVRTLAAAGRALRTRGGGTKLGWGNRPDRETTEIDTRGLNRIVEHNAGDFTAVLGAGVKLSDAQAVFARTGQVLARDPPLGADDAATIGGILAANDSGPARHRYGSMRDLVIGITVVLSDGTIAKSGGKVIKNVAGYDLAKLFTGSFGTLGLIGQIAVRLHPLAARTATVVASTRSVERMSALVIALARLPLEADCFDVLWTNGSGNLLIRFAGAAAEPRAHAAAQRITGMDAVEILTDDEVIWAHQRSLQRGALVLKVSARPTDLPKVLHAADAAGGTVVSRAALGLSWISLPESADVGAIRSMLLPRACTVLDGAGRVTEPWPAVEPGVLKVMQRVKARFDTARAFQPGVFTGGI
jgi:glycolate oxidase FAD binding subunit